MRSLSPLGVRNCAARVLPKGTVLISSRAPVGYCVVADQPLATNQGFKSLVLRGEIDPFYVRYYVLRSKQYLRDRASGTTFKELSGRAMGDLAFPVPSLVMQRRITARIDELFSEIDEGVQGLREADTLAGTYQSALLKAAAIGDLTAEWRSANPASENGDVLLRRALRERRLRWSSNPRNAGRKYAEPPGPIGDLPSLPSGWFWATLQQLAFVSGGIAVDKKRRPIRPIEVPYLRVANVQRGRLDLSTVKSITIEANDLEGLRLQDGDVLLNEGGDRDKVGRGWVWRSDLPQCVHQNHVFKARPATAIVRSELMSIFLNEVGRRFFLDESKQTTNLASISLSRVSAAPVAVPPPAEADAILALLDRYARENPATAVKAAMVTANALRQSILAAAFRGDLVV